LNDIKKHLSGQKCFNKIGGFKCQKRMLLIVRQMIISSS